MSATEDTVNEISDEALARLLRRVQGLITKADHPNTTPIEAKSYRDMAEALMWKYRINAAALGSTDTDGGGQVPEWRRFNICNMDSEFRSYYRVIFNHVLSHFECRGVTEYDYEERVYYSDSVGMRGELRMAEALYTAFMLAFGMKMEPAVQPELSDQENAYLLRSAGIEGWRIAAMLWPDVPNGPDGKPPKPLRVKARGLFKKEAIARGEDPQVLLGKGNSVANYREDYATGFANEVWHRLSRMRQGRAEISGELVLAGQKEKVDEALYERYPQLRPARQPAGPPPPPENANCPKCKAAKSGYCREHAWMKPRTGSSRQRSFNAAAYDRGQHAAQSVDLGPGSGERKVQTPTRGELS